MIEATRPAKPASLVKNQKKWTRELLEALAAEDEDGTPVPAALWRRYDKPDVRSALKAMYGARCCYCEARVVHVATQEIEHRMPKAKDRFPEKTFDWTNLHLACPACNNNKASLWDVDNPILDAVTDAPIRAHLTYKWRELLLQRSALTNRGTVTIQHTRLNRKETVHQRTTVAIEVMQTIADIKAAKEEGRPLGDEMLAELRTLADRSEYASVIQWTLENYCVDEAEH